jgi:IS30 family transposase
LKGDLITGKGRKSAILVTAGRKNQFVPMDLLKSTDARTARRTIKTIEKRFKKLEPAMRKSLTFDLGKESSGHRAHTEHTAITVYFCHPRSPWEKGTGENTHYLIRNLLYPAILDSEYLSSDNQLSPSGTTGPVTFMSGVGKAIFTANQ